ncbi:MAG TPA: helix-hairpin-helix domain-containing protein, partial [Kouleothrix sp.]|nr:helix-hairpin-helix domain-containing protein [Kouleothrix sp.]
ASPASAAGAAAQDGAPIDINSASAAELDGIAGIGQALAQRIIEYRAAHGPFKSVDELNNVKGIGATLLGKIAPSLTAGP